MTPRRLWSPAQGARAALRVGFLDLPSSLVGSLDADADADVDVESVDVRGLSASTYDVVVCGAHGYLVASALLPDDTRLVVHADLVDSVPEDLARADLVVVPTEDEADLLRRRLAGGGPAVVAVPPSVGAATRSRSTLDERLIVAAGPLTSDRRHLDVIRAFAEVADRLPEWRLRIAGSGGRRNALVAEARRHGLSDRVEVVDAPDPAAAWVDAGLGVVTTRHHGLADAADAMAAGVPVVACDSMGGPRDLIDNGRSGVLVPSGNARALGAALERLAGDEAARRSYGAAALTAVQALDPVTVGARWLSLLEETAQRPRAERSSAPTPDPAPLITPARARTEILAWATALAARASDLWWVLPTPDGGDPVVAMPYDARDRFLEALAAEPGPAYAWLGEPEQGGRPARSGHVNDLVDSLRRGATSALTLAPGPLDRPHHLTTGAGVGVEFWTELGGLLYAPRSNVFGRRLDPAHPMQVVTWYDVEVRTLPQLTRPHVHECDFPVDVVYTWVDGADPVWQESRDQRLGAGPDQAQEAAGEARFRSWDELRYSLRSVHLFAPWVRTIHLVTAGQRPDWLADDSRVRVVDHREILPDDVLPTFSSHAIETALHRVPGLAEHFVYLNDDMLLARPMPPTAFFTPSGLPHVFPGSWPIGLEERPERPDLMAGVNNRRLIEREYGVTITRTLDHAPYAHRVSLLTELSERFDEVARTAATPFRSGSDVSLLSSFAQHVGLITGRAVVAPHESRFVDLAAPALPGRFRSLLARDQDSFCLGDHHDHALPEARVAELLADFLENYYPVPAPWEKSRG